MILFLLKSSACLALFLMFYKLLLEKESLHTFKRYYLLVVLVLALVIPSITFTEYVEVIPATPRITPVDMISTETPMAISENTAAQEVDATGIDYWPLVLWTLYGLGVLLFSVKFFFNLKIIANNIRNNQKLKIDSIINVLLKDAIVPHTFLNYIFLNRQKFESNEIPKDVLVHEATHARQKHSLDVLFVELLQIVFWFNPLIHWTKKSIKLNHEFLADSAVIHQGSATADYQNILLTFASSANYKSNQPSMANAINYSSYSSIKKRFKVMKTQTSKKSVLIRSLLLLPLFALLLYGFSTKVQLPKVYPNTSVVQEGATNTELSKFNTLAEKYNAQPQENRVIPADDLKILEDIYGKMTEEQKTYALPFPECFDPKASNQEGATKNQVGEFNELAKIYNTMLASKGNIRIKKWDVDRLEYLYGIMTADQRSESEPFPDFPEPPEPPMPPSQPDQPKLNDEEYAEEVIEEIIANQDPYDGLHLIRPSNPTDPDTGIFYLKNEQEIRKIPAPQSPSPPKSPLELLKELKKDNAKIILDGKEIGYAEAEKLFEKNTFSRVNVRKETGGRTVVEVSTD